MCLCECGIQFETIKRTVNKKVRSCGCSRIKDLSNTKIGILNILNKTNKRNKYDGSVIWKCKCDCGKIIDLSTSQLKHPQRISCGCFKENIINSCKKRSGINHYKYNTNFTIEQRLRIRINQKEFCNKTFIRDNYTCKKCNQYGGNLEAHHINSYDWFISGRNDINNSVTLCVKCHKQFHKKYGYGKNTKEQFVQFIEVENGNL